MAQKDFIYNLIGGLGKTKSIKQIKADLKTFGDVYMKLVGNLDMPKTRKYIKNQLKGLNLSFTMTPTVNTKGVQQSMKQAVTNAQKIASSNKVQFTLEMDKAKLQNQLKNFAKENSKLFTSKEMTAKYNQLVDSAAVAKSKSELKALRSQLSAFRTELVATGKSGMTWINKFKASIAHFAQYFSGASFIYFMTNQFRSAWTEAKTLDDSLTDLMKVTNEIEDRDALYKYFDKAMSKAKELNVTVDSLIYAITEFKKLGWSLSDAELGGQWATILENVGDVDIDTAIGSIKTAIASFDEIGGYGNDQMDKKLEAYVDLINNMSNKYSIDAQGLSEAIRLSAGTLTEANTSIEQAATMFATANKYYNDPDYLGNTAKIGSLRLRATTGDDNAIKELSEMGEDVEEVTALTGKLREELIALTGVDIMVDNNTFKSYYDQLYEISQVIDDLDDTTSAKVLEMLFGKNRAAAGASLLSSLQDSEQAYKDALNSAGSATIEYEKWTQSADAACQRFKNSVTEMYQSIISGNTVRDIANVGSALLDFANKFGIIEGTIKGFLALKIGGFLTNASMAFLTATKSIEQYGKALQLANNIPNGNLSQRYATLKSIAQATSSLTTVQLKQVLSSQQLTQQDRIRILQMQGMTKEMALQKLAEMNLTQATNAQTAANTASTASTFSLKSAMVGLGATMKSVFLSNPVGIVLMGISVGVSAVTSAVSSHNQKMEEMRDKAKEAAETANTLGDEISNLASKYISLSEAVKTDASAKEDLMSTQAELLKKLGLEGETIDDLITRYGSLSDAIKQASIDSLQNNRIDLLAGVNATKEELLDVGSDGFWGGNNIINATGKDAVKAFKELEKAGIIDSGSFGSGGGALVLTGDDTTVEGILENYQRLEDAIIALQKSNAFAGEELSENSLFTAMYARYSEMKDEVEAYNSAINELNENLAQEMMLTALQGSELPKTEEEFEKFRQELIDTSIASKQFIGNEKEITDAVNDYLSTVPQFEGFYSIPLENELDKVDALLGQETPLKLFIDTLNSADYAEIKDELLELAKSGEITPETLSSTKEYAELLSKTDTSAESATNQILDLLTAQEKLSGLSQGLDKLKTAYEEFKDEDIGFVTAETLSSLPDAFKNLPEFDLFSEIVGDPTSGATAIQQAFNDIVKAYMLSQDTLQGLVGASEHDIQSYIANIKQMGVTNAEEVVNIAVKALNTENELINGAQAELEVAYERHLEDKSYDYERYLKNQSSQNTALVNALGETYKADYDNWCELLHDKAEAYNQFIKALEESGIVYDSSKSVQENAQNAIKKEGYSPSEIDRINRAASNAELSSYLADKQKQALQLDLSQITTDFGTKYSPSSSSKGSSGSSDSNEPSEVTQEFNWIEKYLESFARRTEKIMNKISDYLSFKKNISTIKSAIKSVRSELSANEQALAEYAKQMNAIGLDAKYVEKIKNGALEIETITGYETDGNKDANAQLIEKIEKYQDLYDKYTDIEDTIEDLRETEKEWLVKNLEYVNEYYQKLSDIKNLAIDKKQDNIDLKEAQGKKVTTSDYSKLVSYNEDYIKSLRTTYKKTNAEFNKLVKNGTIEKNSAEWFEWKETLADLNSEIVQAQINTAEWKDEIEDLKIQKYTDAIDKLKIKNEELNDAISEREAIGLDVREKDYSAVVKNNNKQISQLEKQNALLYKYQSQVQKGSERWKEFQEQIDSNNTSIRQLNQSTTELIKNIANIPIEERDKDLEDSSNRLALLQKKYDNATSLQERKQILKLMEEEQKKQKEINEQAKNATKSNLSTSQNNLLSYKNNQQSIVQKAEGDVKSHETYISSKEKELDVLNKQEKSLNSKISALDKKIAKTKDKTLLKQLKKQKEKYEKQLNSTKAQQIAISSELELAKKDLAKSKEELATAQKNVSALSGFKEGEKMDTDGVTDKDTLKMIKEYNLALEAYEQAEYDCAIADEEWTNQMRENAQNRLDIIKEEYEALIDLTNSYSDATNSLIDMRKLQGNVVGDELYESLINNSQKNVEFAYEEWQKHSQQMAENDYTNDPEGYQKALAENNRLQQAWYDSVKTAEEQLDNLMNTRIEALEEEKEKLQELHDLQERRYKLEEAKYNLEKAKQRTNLVYNGEEFVYKEDTNALKEAEKALEEAQYSELINKIDDWIETMEEAKEDINLYDADGNALGSTEDIIKVARELGDNLLDGLEKLLKLNNLTFNEDGEITKVQAFAEGGVVGKTDDDKFKAIAKSLGEDNLVAVKNGEMVLTKLQSNELYKKLVGTGTVPTPILDLKPVIPDNLVRVNTAPNVSIDMSGMQFNEVQNMDEFTREIQKMANKASSIMVQEVGKLKM